MWNTLRKIIVGVFNFLKQIYTYLSVYEHQENLKKICLWSIIFIITFVPYFTSIQAPPSEMPAAEEISHDIDVINPVPSSEIQYDITEVLNRSTSFIWNNFHNKYTINKITYRHDTINIWLYSNDYKYKWNDLKLLGDYIKSTMKDCRVVIIYNYPNRLLYGVTDYVV